MEPSPPLRHEGETAGEVDRPHILVVDDDLATRRLLQRVLTSRGFEVTEAEGGRAALDSVRNEDLDLVVLDVGLPDISGLEVLRRIRLASSTATLPVVLLTGRAHPNDRVDGFEAGASDYLTKPIELDELVARVRAQVRGRQVWRSQVADALHRRAALAGALASIPEDLSPEVAASRVVHHLAELEPVRSAGFVHLTDSGAGRLLGGTHLAESGGRVGDVLPTELVQDLLRVAAGQDPVLGRSGVVSAERAGRRGSWLQGDVLVVALGPPTVPWGLLLLEADPRLGAEGARRVAVTASDLLPVVDRVLGPPLARWGVTAVTEEVGQVIEQRAFVPHAQPIVDLERGTVVGFEALSRFTDGTRPDLRFAQASRAGLRLQLEEVTLEAALRASSALPEDAFLSVNVSVSFLLAGRLGELLALAPDRELVLEVTEHEQVEDYEAVEAAVDDLGPRVRLSVDDTGSGFSSLRHVFALQPDYVKLDRAWVSDVDLDPARQALLLGVGQFARLAGGSTIAEGIETTAELAAVRRLGIPLGQGFLLGYPLPTEDYAELRHVELPVAAEREDDG